MRKAERQMVFDKYGGRCAYCGCELQKGWHVDHLEPCRRIVRTEEVLQPEGIFPRYKLVDRVVGFSNPEANHIDNYMPACASCNINKHSMSVEDFRSAIAAFIKHLNELSTQYKIAKRYGLVRETGVQVKFYFETLINQQ